MSRQRRLSPKEKGRKIRKEEGSKMDTKFSMNQIRPLTQTQEEFSIAIMLGIILLP